MGPVKTNVERFEGALLAGLSSFKMAEGTFEVTEAGIEGTAGRVEGAFLKGLRGTSRKAERYGYCAVIRILASLNAALERL